MKDVATLLFGEDISGWSYLKMIGHIAKQVDVYSQIVEEIAPNREHLIFNLCSESIGNGKKWSLKQAADALKTLSNDTTEFTFLECARMMNQIEARLFWNTLLGGRKPITKQTYLKCILRNGVESDHLKTMNYIGNNFSLLPVINEMLHTPHLLGSDTYIIYRPRPVKAWNDSVPLTEYNGAMCQLVEGKGNKTIIEKDEFVIELEDEIVTDVYYSNHPELKLKERLNKYLKENNEYTVALPIVIPSWTTVEAWAEDNTVRFPDMGIYKLNEISGYILVLNHLIRAVKIAYYEPMGANVKLGIEILDGTDFMPCGTITLDDSNDVGNFYSILSRFSGFMNSPNDDKQLLPDEVCVVMDIVTPTFDLQKNEFIHPTFITFNTSKGIQDITQLVDLVI